MVKLHRCGLLALYQIFRPTDFVTLAWLQSKKHLILLETTPITAINTTTSSRHSNFRYLTLLHSKIVQLSLPDLSELNEMQGARRKIARMGLEASETIFRRSNAAVRQFCTSGRCAAFPTGHYVQLVHLGSTHCCAYT